MKRRCDRITKATLRLRKEKKNRLTNESTSTEIENREEIAIADAKPKLRQIIRIIITNSHRGSLVLGILIPAHRRMAWRILCFRFFVFFFFCILPFRSSLYSSVFEFKENSFRLHRLCAMKNVEIFKEADPN